MENRWNTCKYHNTEIQSNIPQSTISGLKFDIDSNKKAKQLINYVSIQEKTNLVSHPNKTYPCCTPCCTIPVNGLPWHGRLLWVWRRRSALKPQLYKVDPCHQNHPAMKGRKIPLPVQNTPKKKLHITWDSTNPPREDELMSWIVFF